MITSYISEHTAEYVLVPAMKSVLEQRFSVVLPMYPWLSREFGKLAKGTHGFSSFRVLALFPRRPKISLNNIHITINSELSTFENLASENGMVAIVGCPMARNLRELASCQECVWLRIGDYNGEEYLSFSNSKRLKDSDVLDAVCKSEEHSMDTFEQFIRYSRSALPVNFFGARYKPVYFLVAD